MANVFKVDIGNDGMSNILRIMHGLNAAMVLKAAVRLGVFDVLFDIGKPATAQEIAEKASFHPDATERLLHGLNSLQAIDVISMDGKVLYQNNATSDLLRKNNNESLAGLVEGRGSFFKFHFLEDLDSSIKGETKSSGHHHHGHSHESSGAHEHFDPLAMYQITHNSLVKDAPKLVTIFDLKYHKSALDLGGGTGVLSYALKEAYPGMVVYMNDKESSVEIAKEHYYKGKEHLDIKFLPGDFTSIKIPKVDLFIMSQVLHHVDNPTEFLAKLYNLLSPGGGILLLESVLKDDKSGPLPTLLWDLCMLNMAGPDSSCMRQKSAGEYKEMLSGQGFTDIKIALTHEYCEYDAIYARKP